MSKQGWPYDSLTTPPTNLKEAIDWVLRVTGKDGKKNEKKDNALHCLCYLAKAVKDLLYDAKSPGSPGPSTHRNWDDILLTEESTIVKPVLTDLGLLGGSTGAASSTCAGGTEVIGTLIYHLAQGLQKWVGWRDQGDECCLKGTGGIGKKCDHGAGGAANCCGTGGSGTTTCHQCTTCGTGDKASNKCYLSAYQGVYRSLIDNSILTQAVTATWTRVSSDSTKVHLLSRIFLGSVCLIWSGLSQLGWLTGKFKIGQGSGRWMQHVLNKAENGLGSFMAAMGYDLERLNQEDKNGTFVNGLLTNDKTGIPWKEFQGDSTSQKSVAEYYSSIYKNAEKAGKSTTEEICKEYPLLVLHILASGYFRAGSAGAKGIKSPPKAAQPATGDPRKPRNPRTIREILYWLSALPYSEKYRELVGRMKDKTEQVANGSDEKDIKLYNDRSAAKASTTLKRDCITHYLMAACGYCPLVLIGIQGTIEREVKNTDSATQGSGGAGDENKCKRKYDEKTPNDVCSKCPSEGKVCYRGYHLEVSKFGPLHGMYANGLYGFDMDGSPAQCLDQLRIYVYHCFYQLYFLRKQCKVGVVDGTAGTTVLGWKSCRYGYQVSTRKGGNTGGADTKNWMCKPLGPGGGNSNGNNQGGSPNQNNGNKCNCLGQGAIQDKAGSRGDGSPLQSFLCDSINGMHCKETIGRNPDNSTEKNPYPEIIEHVNTKDDIPKGHFEAPKHCSIPMGWEKETHFKDLNKGTHKTGTLSSPASGSGKDTYPIHCTGNTLSHLLEYYCYPEKCPSGTLVVLLRLLACITPTVPRTLGDLFGFYYYIVYIGGNVMWDVDRNPVRKALKNTLDEVSMGNYGIFTTEGVVRALTKWKGEDDSGSGCSTGGCKGDTLKCLTECTNGAGSQYLCPLSGQQYGQLSPAMAGTYLSWLVYLIGEFKTGLEGLKEEFTKVDCKRDGCRTGPGGAGGCSPGCGKGTHGNTCDGSAGGVCGCTSVVSCTGVLPVLYRYGFGYGDVTKLHKGPGLGPGGANQNKTCDAFLTTLTKVLDGQHLRGNSTGHLHHEINQLIYTTRLPWIFVLTLAWLVAVLYLAFGAIWPLDWTHMRSHCRGWFRKGSLSPWEVLMVGKKKGRGILEFFGGR